GEVHPRRPRRARRVGLAGEPDARADLPTHASPGARVVGGAPARDRRRRAGDPPRPAAHGQPRRAPAARPAAGAEAHLPLRRRLREQEDEAVLQSPHELRARELAALAARALGPPGRGARAPLRGDHRGARGRRGRLRAASAANARALPGGAGLAPRRLPRRRRQAGGGEDLTQPADLVFVGGTGRSGTTVLAELLDRHSRFRGVPIECRFHCNPKGLADVVGGRATVEEFVRKLETYWWYRIRVPSGAIVPVGVVGRARVALNRAGARLRPGRSRVRGLHQIVPRERLEAAIAAFE